MTGPEPIDAAVGMRVEKTGRATGCTTGIVSDVCATVPLAFDIGLLHFDDQILIKTTTSSVFADDGDLGSLVVDVASGRATGLLIGGSSEYSIANHIGDVLQILNVTLVA